MIRRQTLVLLLAIGAAVLALFTLGPPVSLVAIAVVGVLVVLAAAADWI